MGMPTSPNSAGKPSPAAAAVAVAVWQDGPMLQESWAELSGLPFHRTREQSHQTTLYSRTWNAQQDIKKIKGERGIKHRDWPMHVMIAPGSVGCLPLESAGGLGTFSGHSRGTGVMLPVHTAHTHLPTGTQHISTNGAWCPVPMALRLLWKGLRGKGDLPGEPHLTRSTHGTLHSLSLRTNVWQFYGF